MSNPYIHILRESVRDAAVETVRGATGRCLSYATVALLIGSGTEAVLSVAYNTELLILVGMVLGIAASLDDQQTAE